MKHRVALFGALLISGLATTAVVACGNNQFTGEGNGDSGSDAVSSDVGALGPDASIDAAPVTFVSCTQVAPVPYFCADFDEAEFVNAYQNGVPGTLFTGNVVTDGGTLGSGSGGESVPNLLSSFVPMVPGGSVGTAAAIAPLTPTGMRRHYRLDLDFRVDILGSTAAGSAISLFSLKLYTAGDGGSGNESLVYYRIAVQDTQLALGIGAVAFSNYPLGNIPPVKTWTHAMLDVDFGSNHLDVAISGLPNATFLTGASYALDQPTISLGVVSPGGSDAVKVSFDNVTLTVDDVTDGG